MVMAVLAWVIERAVLRSIRKGTTTPRPPESGLLMGTGAEISADQSTMD
jgi:hypothetical protein